MNDGWSQVYEEDMTYVRGGGMETSSIYFWYVGSRHGLFVESPCRLTDTLSKGGSRHLLLSKSAKCSPKKIKRRAPL